MISRLRYFLNLKLKELLSFFRKKHYRTFFWLVLKYGGKKRYHAATVRFSGYKLTIPDTASFIWQFKEIFADEIYRFNSIASPLIIDCGANIGMSCLYYKKLFPQCRVLAYEPDENICRHLKSNLSANGAGDVAVMCKAVWIHNGQISFHSDGADGGSVMDKTAEQKVDCVRLRDVLTSQGEVHFLKIDIEGAEVEVMMDCKDVLSGVDNIFIEYHSYSKSPQQLDVLLQILSQGGFRYFVEAASHRKKPFINTEKGKQMDTQVNIFAYRDN